MVEHQDGVSLHPDLFLWEKQLSAYRQQWFECADKNPIAWYAALCDVSPTALLIERCSEIPANTSQCWSVSPYHAQIARHTIRVYPEGLFPWSRDDADALCEILNPLLAEEGMQFCAVGAALLLCCDEPMYAYPQGFGAVSGQRLPDRDHEGEDGGRLNRLLSEIQMLLFQHPSVARHDRGEVDVSGVWLWSPVEMPVEASNDKKGISVATRNPMLQELVDGKNATVIITEVERLSELVHADVALPRCIVLAGVGHAVLLRKSWLPRFGHAKWQPKALQPEALLRSKLL